MKKNLFFLKGLLALLLMLVGVEGAWAANYLPGSWNVSGTTWLVDDNVKFDFSSGTTGTLSLTLAANTTYKFKIKDDSNWYGNSGTMTSSNCTRWDFGSDNKTDCQITTTIDGTYTFTITWNGSIPTLSVIYPPYYIKHPWNGGSGWTWKEVTANGDGTWSAYGLYGGTGCNWNASSSDTGSTWVESPTLIGSPATGDNCKFTLNPTAGTITITKANESKIIGGDLSLVPAYVSAGDSWLKADGTSITTTAGMLNYVKGLGWNSVRVRLFVDPSQDSEPATCQTLSYVSTFGAAIKNAGLNFLLDIHYSDTWADPGTQKIPASWTDKTNSGLADQVYSYTKEVLNTLKTANATPDFVQIGNEINGGMLWSNTTGTTPDEDDYATYGYCPYWATRDSYSTSWERLCQLLHAGSKAVRELCPDAKIIVHNAMEGNETDNCLSDDYLPNFYTYITQSTGYPVYYDIIGLSYYPTWHGPLDYLGQTISKLQASLPTKEIQIVETGWYYSYPDSPKFTASTLGWDVSAKGQYDYLKDLTAKLNDYYHVTGLYYWQPEECGNGQGSTTDSKTVMNAWDNRGLWVNSSSASHSLQSASSGNTTVYPINALTDFSGSYTDDFTIRYIPDEDHHNVTIKGNGTVTDAIADAKTAISSYATDNTLMYDETGTYTGTTKNNVVVKGTGDAYTCKNLVLTDKVDFCNTKEFTASSATYSRTIGTTPTWGTICMPYVPTADGMKFYTLKQESDKTDGTGVLTFEEVTSPEANVPYVFKTDGSQTEGVYTISNTGCDVKKTADLKDNTSAGWTLKGLYVRTTVAESESVTMPSTASDTKVYDANSYYIKSNKFYKINNTFTSSAFRAYFSVPESTPGTGAKASLFTIEEDNTATALNTLLNPDEEVTGYYNADGAEMDGIHKGLNIIKYKSGKTVKVMIK